MTHSEKQLNSVAIVGCGDIGCRVAKRLLTNGMPAVNIVGLARTPSSLSAISQLGIGAFSLDLDSITNTIHSVTTTINYANHLVFYFAPPPNTGEQDTRMRHWLSTLELNNLPTRIVYISTTGVYGDQQGQSVTEQTATLPQASRAKRRLDAETALQQFAQSNSVETVILRVASIYGLQRLPKARLENSLPVLEHALAPYTNHIHQDDLAQICITASLHAKAGEVFNVSDNDRMTMTEYFNQVADYLNLPRPPTINWQQAETTLSEGMLSYLKESRIIDNSKLLSDLNITLQYPSLSDFFKL